MDIGDQLREIGVHDRFIVDASGNVAGVQSPLGSGSEGRFLTPDQAAAVAAGGPRFGTPIVIYGDSMADQYEGGAAASSMTYDPLTGNLSITFSGAHGLWVGSNVSVWNYSYRSLRNQRRIPVQSITSSTILVVNLPDKPSDLPGGVLAGSPFVRTENGRYVGAPLLLAQMKLGWPLNVIRHTAQSGEYSKGGADRLAIDVLAYRPAMVIMQSLGINDQTYSGVDAPATFLSEDQTIFYNKSIYDRILASGACLIVGTITPVATGEARANKDMMDRVIRINRWTWDYARGKRNMMVYDAWADIIDPSNATGLGFANRLKADAIHYGIKGAMRVEARLRAIIASLVPQVPSSLPKSLIESHNTGNLAVTSASGAGDIVTVVFSATHRWRQGEKFRSTGMADAAANGVFRVLSVPATNQITYRAPGLATTGAIGGTKILSRSDNIFRNNLLNTATSGNPAAPATGTVANLLQCSFAGTTTSCVGTASVAADDSGFGNKQVFAVTQVNADGTTRTQIENVGTSSWATEMAGNGRTYRAEWRLRLKSTSWPDTLLSDIRAYFNIVGSDGRTYVGEAMMNWDGAETGTLIADQDWHVRTPDVTVPAGVTVTASNFMSWVRHSAAITGAATFTMEVAQVAIYDVTND